MKVALSIPILALAASVSAFAPNRPSFRNHVRGVTTAAPTGPLFMAEDAEEKPAPKAKKEKPPKKEKKPAKKAASKDKPDKKEKPAKKEKPDKKEKPAKKEKAEVKAEKEEKKADDAEAPAEGEEAEAELTMAAEEAEPEEPAGKPKVPCVGASPLGGGKTFFFGEAVWDAITLDWGSAETGKFVRAAELKHGRAAMLGTVGYWFHQTGLTFDQISVHEYLSVRQDIRFADLAAMSPVQAMKSLPVESWGQMFGFCAFFEIYELTHSGGKLAYDEAVAPGLKPGGLTGDLGWNPLQITIDDRRRTAELQNGRAAMFAISAWIAAETVPGSMPLPLFWAKP